MTFHLRAAFVLSPATVAEHGVQVVVAVGEDRNVGKDPLNRLGAEGIVALAKVKINVLVGSESCRERSLESRQFQTCNPEEEKRSLPIHECREGTSPRGSRACTETFFAPLALPIARLGFPSAAGN